MSAALFSGDLPETDDSHTDEDRLYIVLRQSVKDCWCTVVMPYARRFPGAARFIFLLRLFALLGSAGRPGIFGYLQPAGSGPKLYLSRALVEIRFKSASCF